MSSTLYLENSGSISKFFFNMINKSLAQKIVMLIFFFKATYLLLPSIIQMCMKDYCSKSTKLSKGVNSQLALLDYFFGGL